MRGVIVPPSKLIVTIFCPPKGGFLIRGGFLLRGEIKRNNPPTFPRRGGGDLRPLVGEGRGAERPSLLLLVRLLLLSLC